MKIKRIVVLLCLILSGSGMSAQISPGDLSKAHSGLEGVGNCTKCHDLGHKVTRAKCLDCHQEIRAEIAARKGYHSTPEVGGKECFTCHNEHHGLNFQLIRFERKKFDHRKTGFELKGRHAQLDCNACHRSAFIKDASRRKRASTFMGLKASCLNCHEDHHQGSMSTDCASCHGFSTFKGATGFNHDRTRFPLLGQHKNVACAQCHKTENIKGRMVQKFKGIAFANCTACHRDVHENRFGSDCRKCHTETSFHSLKSRETFDHDNTGFKLEGTHASLDCRSCHKSGFTTPLPHGKCSDCHADYHKKEFARNGSTPDCATCHSTRSFSETLFTIERHNQTGFPLDGAHMATPCNSCHKTTNEWHFRNMGQRCVDCHQNVHQGLIKENFMPDQNCRACHGTGSWQTIRFDHARTGFKLEGAHAEQKCSACHFSKDSQGRTQQKFAGMESRCSACHKDPHAGQFQVNGSTDCARCHGFNQWSESKFDHNTSRFKLEGAHAFVKCEECHKKVTTSEGSFTKYKFESIECSNCHR